MFQFYEMFVCFRLLSLGADCLRAVTVSVDATCDDEEVLVALRNIISASDVALKQIECKYETTAAANTFPGCEGKFKTFFVWIHVFVCGFPFDMKFANIVGFFFA